MDIRKFESVQAREDEGIEVVVKDEVGNATDATITVVGSYSSKFRKLQLARRNRDMKRRSATITAEEVERRRVEDAADCIISWKNLSKDGEPYPFTRENAIALLLHDAPWIVADLEEGVYDHAAFFSKAAPNS